MGKSKKETAIIPSGALQLDAIYDSSDPNVKRFLLRTMHEEYERADERVLQRVAKEFIHLLPSTQQRLVQQTAVA